MSSLEGYPRRVVYMRLAAGMLILAAACVPQLLAQSNPVPLINQPLVPDARPPGAAGFTLTVNGTGFASDAVVDWNGSPLATTFVSGSQLTASVPASNIAAAGTALVTVVNPAAPASNAAYFEVTTAASAVASALAFSASTAATGRGPAGIVAADFNGDGKLDLAVANSIDNTVSILLGNGDGSFASHVDYPASSAYSILVGDFNNDGKLDLVVGNSILLGNGDGTFQPFLTTPIAGKVAADFNGDGKLDLAATGLNSAGVCTIMVALGNGDGTFQAPVTSPTLFQVPGLVGLGSLSTTAGDFNGDGKLDLAVAGPLVSGGVYGDSYSVQLGNGDGTFQAGSLVTSATFGFYPWLGFGDFNGDSKLDIAGVDCFTRDTLTPLYPVFLGEGNGAFSATTGLFPQPFEFPCGTSGLIGDFNGDGKLDLAAVNGNVAPPGLVSGNEGVSVLLGRGDGSLEQPMEFPTGSLPVSAAAGDFNGDGRLDLAVTNSGDNTVSILLQQFVPLYVSPTALTFGTFPPVSVGSTSAAQTVLLTNVGSTALGITNISIGGLFPQDYAQTNTCGTSLAAGASCTVSVTFTPSFASFQLAATLMISYNGAASPQSVALAGESGTPVATLSTTSLNFGYHVIGTPSLPQTVTLTNTGSQALTITGVTIQNSSLVGFSQTNTCGSIVPVGASCVFTVTYTPTMAEPGLSSFGVLTITDDATPGTQSVTLLGTPAATATVVSPASLDFGSQPVGSTQRQLITLANAGNAPILVRRVLLAGSESFTESNSCPATLEPGAACSISVTFTPKSKGSQSGLLLIVDTGKPRPVQIVRLTGSGQ